MSRRPPTQTFVCLLASFLRIPWRQVLWGLKSCVWRETYCLVSAFSSVDTSKAQFCSLIDVCLFNVSNVDIALCVTLNQRHTGWNNMDFHLINKDLYPVDQTQENENIAMWAFLCHFMSWQQHYRTNFECRAHEKKLLSPIFIKTLIFKSIHPSIIPKPQECLSLKGKNIYHKVCSKGIASRSVSSENL